MEIKTIGQIIIELHTQEPSKRWVAVDDLIREIDAMRDIPFYCESYEWQDVLQRLKDKLTQKLNKR